MNDYSFGNRLSALRRQMGISQAQLGQMVGVSNKSVSKWENGAAKPGVGIISKLALALNISMDSLLTEAEASPEIHRIVITGGPCAGKTTAMSWIQNAFTKKGYSVIFIPETATELISSGAAPWLCRSGRGFQASLMKLQLDKEQAYTSVAALMKNNRALVVCDRGALDNKAYMSDLDFQYVAKRLGNHEVELRDHYDAVFHLVTAAKGAEAFYTLANNQARTETPEQARELDDRLISAWTGHPHLRVIDNSTGFEKKMLRLISEVSSFLGEPEPMETERKYLIVFPDLKRLEKMPNCTKVEIIQTYLRTGVPGEEVRIRQRGSDGHYIYFKTHKRQAAYGKRIEIETRLSQEEYLGLMMDADPGCRQIRKTRYCLSANGMYYEIDIYPSLRDKAILEVELRSMEDKVVIPKYLKVIKEVTGEEAWLNHSLACRGFPE